MLGSLCNIKPMVKFNWRARVEDEYGPEWRRRPKGFTVSSNSWEGLVMNCPEFY